MQNTAQNIIIPREEWDIMRKYWTKARPKLSRVNIKSYRSVYDVKGLRWLCPSSEGLETLMPGLVVLCLLLEDNDVLSYCPKTTPVWGHSHYDDHGIIV